MKIKLFSMLTIFALLLFIGACTPAEDHQVGAEQEEPEDVEMADTEETKIAEGELIAVSPDDNTLSIRAETGETMEFEFNESTEIAGGADLQGLATKQGSHVRVHYKEGLMNNELIKIEIHGQP